MNKVTKWNCSAGFTLIEMMIALVISLILIAGSVMAYSSISHTLTTSSQLENSQEVLRYSSYLFSRSLKQTSGIPVLNGNDSIIVEQSANVIACNGTRPNVGFTEIYSFNAPNLLCDIGNGNEVIMTGIDSINFVVNGSSVLINVTPTGLPENLVNGVELNVSLTRVIFEQATAE